MKMNDFYLNRKWILLSLVLLSLESFAAENLNFNYTRPDPLTLESRLGLQASKACHSLGDPMNIHVRFNKVKMSNSPHSPAGSGIRVKIDIFGIAYPKSSATFSLSSGPRPPVPGGGGIPVSDNDFLLPWGVSLQGTSEGEVGSIVNAPVPPTYSQPFCFDQRFVVAGLNNTWNLAPIYYFPTDADGNPNPYYQEGLWGKYCTDPKRQEEHTDLYYWPDFYNIPDLLRVLIAADGPPHSQELPGSTFLTKHIFFGGKQDGIPSNPIWSSSDYTDKVDFFTDNSITFSYTFPAASPVKGQSTIIEKGDYILTTLNREIGSITLTIIDERSGKKSVFEWKRSLQPGSYAIDNVLSYQNNAPRQLPISARSLSPQDKDKNDPYISFYNNPDIFRGTLVAVKGLNQKYKNYIDKVMPLSLPATTSGDINLVNTDSLILTIEQTTAWDDKYIVTLFGQPMKFGPLLAGHKYTEVASAMQVRNACY
ncbi:TPA: hypothetical protein ACWV5C_003425 [Salmonella enterica subsp. enterica serovar Muenchen]